MALKLWDEDKGSGAIGWTVLLAAVQQKLDGDCDLRYRVDPNIPAGRMAFPLAKEEVHLRAALSAAINAADAYIAHIQRKYNAPQVKVPPSLSISQGMREGGSVKVCGDRQQHLTLGNVVGLVLLYTALLAISIILFFLVQPKGGLP